MSRGVTCVTDTNIWIDLRVGGLLDSVFELDAQWLIPDLIRRELGEDLADLLADLLTEWGLEERVLSGDEVEAVVELNTKYTGPSRTDMATLVVARAEDGVLVTGDSPAFQSQRRDLLLERFNINGRLLGNNIKLPASIEGKAEELFSEGSETPVSATALIEVYKAHQEKGREERLEDAFQPVRQLVGLEDEKGGPRPLIAHTLYEQVASMDASVWSRITIRSSATRWGFFCLRGQEGRAPRWLLLRRGPPEHERPNQDDREEQAGRPDGTLHSMGLGFETVGWTVRTRLNVISGELRQLLRSSHVIEDQMDPELWASVEGELSDMLTRVRDNEWELLSNRARHGLSLLRNLLPRYQSAVEEGSERDRICAFLRAAIAKTTEPWIDIHDLADRWLGIVQPEYVDRKQAESRGRSDPIRLKDMEGPLAQDPVTTDALRTLACSVRRDEPIKRRIVAAIIAVPTA